MKKYLVLLTIVSLMFFWQVIIQDKIIFPGDMLVGAYYPWLDYKWGTITGVPIKNPYITDIFSQIYLWKDLITKSYLNGQWPLWNQYSYSGYPLLANFQSGALNIFNLIFIIFGMLKGWNIFLITGILVEIIFMFLYLKTQKYSYISSTIASFSFGFSGFSILWMPYANANYSLASIPLALYFIEKYLSTNNKKYLYLISPVIFIIITSGHFQIAIYGLIIISTYLIYKKIYNFLPVIFGILMSAIQLLPTYELSQLSIRFTEGFIKNNNFGLSPLNKLITLFIPDYFGNPSTFNYWGYFNYHETNFYVGVLGIIALIWSIFNYKRLGNAKFFIYCAIISLILGFDTYFGKAIYLLNVPGISTSAAGRISAVFTLSIAILIANFLDKIRLVKLSKIAFPSIIILIINIIAIIYSNNVLSKIQFNISLRNNIYPIIIIIGITISLLISTKIKLFKYIIFIIVIADLYRFGWKSTPFVSKTYVFPKTSLTEYISKDSDIFRVDRENGPILPPNTWTAYNISSPSGYDPLSINDYVIGYNHILNQNNDSKPQVSRYSELYNFDPVSLGDFNVKYLLMQKNYLSDKKTYNYNKKFQENLWLKVYETNLYSLFSNPLYQPRVQLVPEQTKPIITKYSPNSIDISINSTIPNSTLIIRDTFYPGWQASVNNIPINIEKYNNIYRKINVGEGDSIVKLNYHPQSFYIGLLVTIISSVIYLLLLFIII